MLFYLKWSCLQEIPADSSLQACRLTVDTVLLLSDGLIAVKKFHYIVWLFVTKREMK